MHLGQLACIYLQGWFVRSPTLLSLVSSYQNDRDGCARKREKSCREIAVLSKGGYRESTPLIGSIETIRRNFKAFLRESALLQIMLDFFWRRLEEFFAWLCIRWDSVRSGAEMKP